MNLKMSVIKRIRKLRSLRQRYNFNKEYNKIPTKFTMETSDEPLVSIIIPVYNQYKYTKMCLWSILQNTKGIKYEIIIGDDNSSDETSKIKDEIGGLIVSRNSENKGFLLNVNDTVTLAKGKYLAIMNNDVFVKEGWLNNLIDTIESDGSIGYVGAKYLEGNGLVHEAGCFVNQDVTIGFYNQGELAFSKEVNQFKEVDYCSACGVLLKKETWDKVGGFDERYSPGYCEDVDLCFQIKYNLGLKVVYQPKSEMYHLHGQTHGEKTKILNDTNKIKFKEKWSEVLKNFPAQKG